MNILNHGASNRIPRSELWIVSEAIVRAGFEDDIDGCLALRKKMGMDLLALPLCEHRLAHPTQGYRFFNIKQLREAVDKSDLPVQAVIDGPFQSLVENKGLMQVISAWRREQDLIRKELQKEKDKSLNLVEKAAKIKPGFIVLADDLAFDQGTFAAPDELKEILLPFYSKAASCIVQEKVVPLFHSCGNISAIMDWIAESGFMGLAACQSRLLENRDFLDAWKEPPYLQTGLSFTDFQPGEFDDNSIKDLTNRLTRLNNRGRLIASSSSGINTFEMLEKLKEIYPIVDRIPIV